jgi:hypothetical protein
MINLRGLFDDVGGMLGAQDAPVTQSAGLINPHTGQPVSFSSIAAQPWGSKYGMVNGMVGNFQPLLQQANPETYASWLNGQEYMATPAAGTSQVRGEASPEQAAYNEWLGKLNWAALNGYEYGDSRQDYYVTKHLQTPEGKIISGDPVYDRESWNTDDYLNLAAKAALVYGGGLGFDSLMAGAGLGGAGAAEGIGTLGTIEAGSGAVASLPTMAELGLGAATVPTIPTTAAIGGGLGMLGTLLPAVPAVTESGGLLDYLKANPRLVAGLAGGLLGGADAGGGGGGGGYSYSGPMPTITRGGWKPTATPTYSAPAAAPLLNTKPGQANSGLWRYKLGGGQ